MRIKKSKIDQLKKYFNNKPVVRAFIFGSYARGDRGGGAERAAAGARGRRRQGAVSGGARRQGRAGHPRRNGDLRAAARGRRPEVGRADSGGKVGRLEVAS